MPFNNSTLPDSATIEVNKLAMDILQDAAISAPNIIVQTSLSSLFFGILTILDLAAIYFLISGGSIAQTNGRILLLSIILLYSSTATYMAAIIWASSDGSRLISKAVDDLSSASYDGRDTLAAFEHAVRKQSWVVSLTLAVNVVIGDAIVWWRASVIWQHKVVNCIGLLLLTLTMIPESNFPNVFGIIGIIRFQGPETTRLGFLYQELYGVVSKVLSLFTNFLATTLIACKAWQHRQLMKEHFAENSHGTTSRVLKALALLVESGCIYCAAVISNLVSRNNSGTSQANRDLVFSTVTPEFTDGFIVPIVAIYPTIIIVLVALKRSPIDSAGLPQGRRGQGGHGSGMVEGNMSSTIVFHHSTFRMSAASVGTEGATEGIPAAGDPGRTHSLET